MARSTAIAGRRITARMPKEFSYLVAMVLGAVGSIAVLFATLFVLEKADRLPAPAISNNICIDEKLAFMRDLPARSPNLLILGSSVGWRSIDGGILTSAVDGARPLNGAFCGLRMHQIEYVGHWLLDRMRQIQAVALVASPFDFVGCKINPTKVFDVQAADDYVFGHRWKWGFYLRFFDPVSLVRNVLHITAMRGTRTLDRIVFTDFADGPLDVSTSKPTLVYGRLPAFDPSCFDALRRLAISLSGEGRRLAVVATPMHPEWRARFDPDGENLRAFDVAVAAALQGTNAIYWDGEKEMPMASAAFTDAIHMRWSAAREFTRTVASALGSFLAPKTSWEKAVVGRTVSNSTFAATTP